ncbi:MAG: thioesterase, partial [Oscillospiraceae bacterium]
MTIGESRTVSTQVDGHNTAAAVHSGSVEVFATPMMIALMERAASELAERFLEPAQTTVGTGIEVSHTAATPVGMRVEATATLTDVKGRL